MPPLAFAIFLITFLGCWLWVFLTWRFAKLLKAMHPTVYEALGLPMTSIVDLFGNKPTLNLLNIRWSTTAEQNKASIKLVKFILLGKFLSLDTAAIRKLGTFMRWLFLADLGLMVLLVIVLVGYS
ncbi:MAG: hypothetical protein A3E83_03115 [Gammaproteobacteria bacterium RIFCSPHIGHO2_12_FULL_41_20]|nr:MAG: hypothetical protein A3E83_03115 [Gammaproteobacteria bacterium RIFCSPHIGHO2_12_FULL_41_20]